MIADPIRTSFKTKLISCGLTCGLGLALLTGASHASPSQERKTQDLLTVRMTRMSPTPEWHRALRKELAKPISMQLGKTTLRSAIEWLRAKTGLNIVVHPDTMGELGDEELRVDYVEMSTSNALDRLARSCNAECGLRGGAVYIAPGARPLEKRVYDVRDVLAGLVLEDKDADVGDALIELTRSIVATEAAWDREGVRLDLWGGAFVVTQTAEAHEAIHDFLNRLLNRGRGTRKEKSAAQKRLAEKLASKVTVAFDETKIRGVAEFLREHGVHVLVHEDVDPHQDVTFKLRDIALKDVLSYVATFAEVPIVLDEGMVRIGGERAQQVLRYYDIAALLGRPGDKTASPDGLSDLIQGAVPQIWEAEGTKIEFWGDLMLIRQTERGQREVRAFLDAMGKTLAR